MRVFSFIFASSLAVLLAGVGCDDDFETSDGDGRPGGAGGVGGVGGSAGTGAAAGSGGSSDRDAEAPPPEPDASVDAGPSACELIHQAFEAFVAANRSCEEDSDCRIIGDCGPNVDWRAVSASAAEQGYDLMQARCGGGGYDGPEYLPRCEDGQCVVGEQSGWCGNFDAGANESDASSPVDAAVGDGG